MLAFWSDDDAEERLVATTLVAEALVIDAVVIVAFWIVATLDTVRLVVDALVMYELTE